MRNLGSGHAAARSRAALVALLLVACAEKGGPRTLAVAGAAFVADRPLAGAEVVATLAGGGEAGRGLTDGEGRFSFDVRGAALERGIRLTTAGGTAGGREVSSALETILAPDEAEGGAALTVLTTLAVRVGEAVAPGGTLGSRDAGLARLVALGLASEGDWRTPAPATVELAALAAAVDGRGLGPLLDAVTARAVAGELSPPWTRSFPLAHGGIERLRLEGWEGGPSAFPGTAVEGRAVLTLASDDAARAYDLCIAEGPAWLTVDARGLLRAAPPAATPAGDHAYTVRAEERATGRGREVRGTVRVLSAEVVASGVLGGARRRVASAGGDVVVAIVGAAPAAPVSVTVLRGVDLAGGTVLRVTASPPLSLARVVLPDPDLPAAAAEGGVWSTTRRWFWRSGPSRLRLSEGVHRGGLMVEGLETLELVREEAARLVGATPPGAVSAVDPVLFVGGHAPVGGLAGGEDAWGDLPRRVAESGPGFMALELRWRADARLQDAAEDLRNALHLVARTTGRSVHVVAHGLGGLVARTCFQGLSDKGLAVDGMPVASLTTIGTPHAGAFPDEATRDGTAFPRGRFASTGGRRVDGVAAGPLERTGLLAVHQAGAPSFPDGWPWVGASAGTGAEPGEVAAMLASPARPFPGGIPVLALIGLLAPPRCGGDALLDGDGLFTYEAQRFRPDLRRAPRLSGAVSELVLGAEVMTCLGGCSAEPGGIGPGARIAPVATSTALDLCGPASTAPPLTSVAVLPVGYAYADEGAAPPNASEARVTCGALAGCAHATLARVAAFLAARPAPAAPAVDAVRPSPPAGVGVEGISASTVRVTWTPAGGVTGYRVHRDGALVGAAAAPPVNLDGLPDGEQACVQVSAVDAAGNESWRSPEACGTTLDRTPPGVPPNVRAYDLSSRGIGVAWDPSPDNVGVSTYWVYRGGEVIAATASTGWADGGLSPGTRYCYSVAAEDAAGNVSARSPESCANTQ